MKKAMKKSTKIILGIVIGTILTALSYYVWLPPLNIFSTGFWFYLLFVIAAYAVPLGVVAKVPDTDSKKKGATKLEIKKIPLIIAAVPIAVLVLGGLLSSSFFHAESYAQVITVEQAVFAEDMPEADAVTNISLMDTDSAAMLGNREMGALEDMVSQYEVSFDYNQINFQNTPKKVANLEYADFFRWINNRSVGIPGYIMVDPVGNDADYVSLSSSGKSLKYVQSAYFHEDLMRKVRFSYPTKIFSTVNFEIDDQGNPWYIISCAKPRVGLFGAMDINEVILFNPCDGTSTIYPIANTPSWVDNVYDGDLACQKYDWHGTLSGGFWNSIIGKRNCKITTDGYGYIVRDDDVWYFTGVTSVNSDESNIGFIITNARTGAYKYYSIPSAEEYSAMGTAEGAVADMNYKASFPSIVNIRGKASYIMVLKDANGFVKRYALVNAQNATIVATGETQQAAKEAYIQKLIETGEIVEEAPPAAETKTADITVKSVRLATVNGETLVYITADDGIVYRGSLAADETLILIADGDTLTVTYSETDHEKIRAITAWTVKTADPETTPAA